MTIFFEQLSNSMSTRKYSNYVYVKFYVNSEHHMLLGQFFGLQFELYRKNRKRFIKTRKMVTRLRPALTQLTATVLLSKKAKTPVAFGIYFKSTLLLTFAQDKKINFLLRKETFSATTQTTNPNERSESRLESSTHDSWPTASHRPSPTRK